MDFIKDLEQEVTLNLIESRKMSHPYYETGENLARNLQTTVVLNILKYICIVINKETVWVIGKTIATV